MNEAKKLQYKSTFYDAVWKKKRKRRGKVAHREVWLNKPDCIDDLVGPCTGATIIFWLLLAKLL